MAVRERASLSYPILDDWFSGVYATRSIGDYVDIDEIRSGTSAYVTEMGLNAQVEAMHAGFVDMGILLGDTDVGETVVGFLMGQDPTCVDRYTLVNHQAHPICFKRIYYRQRWERGHVSRNAATEAREIKFLGSVRL